MYLGDFRPDATIDFKFTTVNTSGAPTTLTTPFVAIYKDNNTTETVTGIVVTADFDSRTGLNHVRISATGSFYAAGSDYDVVIITGTVAGTSIQGYTPAHFSIDNRPVDLNADQSGVTIGTVTTNSDMRGTDNAALASVLGALNDTAAAGDPTNSDTTMQYIKQLINVLIGSTGITTFPSSAAPGNGVSLAEVLRAVYDDTNELQGDNVPGLIAALNDLSAAQVNAEVVDALATDTYAELAAVPAATSTLADKINWLFALARNKLTQTATTAALRNDADGADIATSTVSDDGTTATRGEWS